MTEQTAERTPEQIVAEAMVSAGAPLMHSRVEEAVVAALRAAGLLVSPPSDDLLNTFARVEKVKQVIRETADFRPYAVTDDPHIAEQIITDAVRAALTAAGVAPQGDVNPVDTLGERAKDAGDSLHVAPQKPSGVRCPACDVDLMAPHNGKGDCPPKPAPTPDREKLIAEADELVASWDRLGSWTPDSPIGLVMRLARELAAPPVIDEAGIRDRAYFALRDAGEGRTTSENMSRIVARALVEHRDEWLGGTR